MTNGAIENRSLTSGPLTMTPGNVKLPGLKPYRLPRVLTPKKNITGEGGWEKKILLHQLRSSQYIYFSFHRHTDTLISSVDEIV